jgi:heme-degrading monooxygenase HmoA
MFARIWRGIVRAAAVADYLSFLRAEVIPAYRRAEGNQSVFILQDAQGELIVFLLLSFWESRAALEKFSDPQLDSENAERAQLLTFESTAAVLHVIEQ